jgi:hypothetical protein
MIPARVRPEDDGLRRREMWRLMLLVRRDRRAHRSLRRLLRTWSRTFVIRGGA